MPFLLTKNGLDKLTNNLGLFLLNDNMKGIFAIHLLCCLMMTGIIWLVQLVHYPLFAHVGESGFATYESLHRQSIGPLVAPLMLIELGTAIWLLNWRPTGIPAYWLWIGLALVGVAWLNTFFQAVPLHAKLDGGYNQEIIQRLVKVNWIRTIAWTARSGILVWMVWKMIGGKLS